ncbi:MAG: transcriptional regulator, family [Rhodospirillales bacterium]|nr:transcriptional regulator, family [Rhodospirillales bacterium]
MIASPDRRHRRPRSIALLPGLTAYPVPAGPEKAARDFADVIVPPELIVDGRRLSFFSTVSVFGTAVDITLSELILECFFRRVRRRLRCCEVEDCG